MNNRPSCLNSAFSILWLLLLSISPSLGQTMSLQQMIQIYPIPLEQLSAHYDQNALPELKQFALDPTMARCANNIMLAIAAVGGEEGTDFLVHYLLNHFEGEVGDNEKSLFRDLLVNFHWAG